jgi:glycosyltransferase involved in cell wall biosynthesis
MLLKNKHILFMGTSKFDGPDQSASYKIARELAKNNFVYYIDYPYTIKDFLKLRTTNQTKRRLPYFLPTSDGVITTDEPNLKVVILPILLSINFLPEGKFYRILLKINEGLIIRRLTRLLKQNDILDYIYINSFNFHYPGVADKLKPRLEVYHCVDPMIMAYDKKHGIISEAELVKKSDLVICTSRQLYKEKKLENNNTFFIANAADVKHSQKALFPETKIHPSLSKVPRPIIGYTGTIERRIDYDLLKKVVEINKDKSFVLAGATNMEYLPTWFQKAPNVFLSGRFAFEEMPEIIKGFDIAIIPFKKDEVSSTIFPLKLFEYLGSGKPVIATNFNPDISEFTGGTVKFCDNAEDFCLLINSVLENDTSKDMQKRIEIAEKNTWEKRGIEFSELLSSALIN